MLSLYVIVLYFVLFSKNINKKNYYIASKYEEIHAVPVEGFRYLIDYSYSKEEVGPAPPLAELSLF